MWTAQRPAAAPHFGGRSVLWNRVALGWGRAGHFGAETRIQPVGLGGNAMEAADEQLDAGGSRRSWRGRLTAMWPVIVFVLCVMVKGETLPPVPVAVMG